MSAFHPHPARLVPISGRYVCDACDRAVKEADAITGEWACTSCKWRAVVWAACSQRCAATILEEEQTMTTQRFDTKLAHLPAEIARAIWEGDVDKLYELAPCRCCCGEHTFENCPARQWGGCRGQGTMTRADYEEWARHYEKFHGMARAEFEGFP
jgi:hypothetical protein